MNVEIVDLQPTDQTLIQQIAEIMVEAFHDHTPAWPDIESALAEVRDSFSEERISRVALSDTNTVLGWIGGISQYDGHVWELHPLVVNPKYQGQGIGRALVADLEVQVRNHGGITLWLGTDDEDGRTSLANIDVYPNVLEHTKQIKNTGGHPFEFYQKCGFVIVGIMPDANGFGKPDIFMAKRV